MTTQNTIKKVGIVYFSKTGVTENLAYALMTGIEEASNISVITHKITEDDIISGRFINQQLFHHLAICDAIAFGSPTYMGSATAQFKAFADSTSDFWIEQGLADKVAIGFTSGASMNGDQSDTLDYFATLASQHGMLWLNLDINTLNSDGLNRMGCQKGIVAYAPNGELHQGDVATARYFGTRLARYLQKHEH